ncbi:MAG: hypothetical protein QW451_01575 [Candidatus Aenigmatarchaeota archaeon]
MNWKILLLVVFIFSLVGFLGFTEEGRKYAEILRNGLGGFTKLLGNFVAPFSTTKSSSPFEFELVVEKEAIFGQTFSFSGSKFFSTCRALSLKIDGKNWEINEEINVSLEGKGSLDFDLSGKAKLSAEAASLQLNNFKTNEAKIEMEFLPEKIYLNNTNQKLINLTSATGRVLKKFEGIEISANFTKSNLKIENFFGSLELEKNLIIYGSANEIEINGKKI